MNKTNPRLKQLMAIGGTLVIIFCVYTLLSTIITLKSTGIIHIDPSVSQSIISVSQANHEAKTVGTGKTSLRLKSGVYQIIATSGSSNATRNVRISSGQKLSVALKLSEAPHIRSVDDVTFNGLSGFSNGGLSEDQITALQLDFFRYKTAAEIVTIDGTSLQPGPRDPKTKSAFTTNFAVTIDAVPYKATITYSGLENTNLALYDLQSNLVFNSDAGSNEASE